MNGRRSLYRNKHFISKFAWLDKKNNKNKRKKRKNLMLWHFFLSGREIYGKFFGNEYNASEISLSFGYNWLFNARGMYCNQLTVPPIKSELWNKRTFHVLNIKEYPREFHVTENSCSLSLSLSPSLLFFFLSFFPSEIDFEFLSFFGS